MTYIDSFSVRDGGLSVSFDGGGSVHIVLPSLDVLSERVVENMVNEFKSRLSSMADPGEMGLFDRLLMLREQFFTPAGRQEVLSQIRVFDAIKVVTATPSTVLAVTIIEADGDIVSRVNEAGAYAYHEELFSLHREAVRYATTAWRKRLNGIKTLIFLGAKLHRALLLVSMGSLIGSAAAWTLNDMYMVVLLGLSVSSFFFSTFLNQFNL